MNNRNRLPILKYKTEIQDKLQRNQIVIIVGETGCGKSTQIPQYLHEFGYTKSKPIVCLHPRSIAASSLAERVSNEMERELGSLIGYHIRFDKMFNKDTRIMFMTTGLLVRQIGMTENVWKDKYSVVVIDEAHERSLQTDLMLGIMKMLLGTRRLHGGNREKKEIYGEPKLIIMSATINITQFTNYFPNSALVEVKEQMRTTDIIYRPLKSENYLNEIQILVKEIFSSSSSSSSSPSSSSSSSSTGDILIFLQSEQKVRKCCEILKKANLPKSVIIKLFSNMDYQSKMKAFREYQSRRKIIVSTNVAETSLTIPGIDIVIDSGAVKQIYFNHETSVEKWITTYVSVAEADQRKGRTGRIKKGKCYRLYEERFLQISSDNSIMNRIKFPYFSSLKSPPKIDIETLSFLPFPEPEIKTGNLGSMILILKLMKIKNILEFPFIEEPDKDQLKEVMLQLKNLSLLDNNGGQLTRLGKHVARLPLDPRLGKVAIVASKVGVSKDVNIMIGMLCGRNIMKTTKRAISYHQRVFHNEHGDLFRLIDIYRNGIHVAFNKEWCKMNYLNHSCLLFVVDIVNQLNNVVPKFNRVPKHDKYLSDCLVKSAFLSAFFQNIAIPSNRFYRTAIEPQVVIHQSSCLAKFRNNIMFHTISSSPDGQTCLRCCTVLDEQAMTLIPSVFDIKPYLWEKARDLYFSTANIY